MTLLVVCSFLVAVVPSTSADPVPPSSEVVLLNQDYTSQAVIPENVVIGNMHKSTTAATLTYNTGAKALQYYSNTDEGGSLFMGIEPFINGNLSIGVKVNSDSVWSSVNIEGSTFWLEVSSLSGGGARVMSYYMTSASGYAYKYYDVPASALPGGVNTINLMISGTSKTVTVYHDAARSVTTPMYHWSVQSLPYEPVTSPIICFDNYISSVATWTSTYIYGVRESVSGGLVSAVPGNDFVPFGIDYPRRDVNQLGTQHMASHGQKGVAWVDLQWLEYQPQDRAYIDSLLAAGWELGIHYNASLNSYSLANAQALMKREYDQVKAMFGRAPTSWCSYQNADSVTHAVYGYQQLGMIWRNGFSGIGFLPNVGNLQETRWTQFWSKISAAEMVYPSFTHKTDQTVAEAYAISYASFTKWVDNYVDKKIIGFNEYYGRISNQVDTKVTYLEYTQGSKLRFSVDCNAFPSRLMIDFSLAQSAAVLRNGNSLVLGTDYSILDGRYIVLFANDNDVIEVSVNGAPGAPRGLTAVGGNAQVALNWAAPSSNGGSPITGYKVYRGTAANAEVLLTTVGSVLTYVDSSAVNGQKYYYKVSAVNSGGESSQSNEVSATPSTAPSAPTGLEAAGGNAKVTLTWSVPASNGGSPITGYKIYRGTASNSEVLLTTVSALTYLDASVVNEVTYYYKVSATNAAGEGTMSSEVSATPQLVVVAPSAPRNLNAAPSDGQVTLTWAAPSSDGGGALTSYSIYRNGALLTTVGSVLTYVDTSVTNGVSYSYAVSASNSAGEGPLSGSVSATPASVPSAPRDLAAAGGNAKVVLTWSAPDSSGGSAVTGYKIYRSTVSGGEVLLATVGNVLTYTDSSAVNGVTYYYQVGAVSSAGEGVRSNEASATPRTVPNAPTGVKATAGTNQVVLTWTAPSSNGGSAVTGYKVFRGTSSGSEVLLTTLGSVLEYTDSNLEAGVTCYYKVCATNSEGDGPLSAEVYATPSAPATAPSAPRSLAAAGGDGLVILTWTVPSTDGGSAITNYRIYRGTASGGEIFVVTVGNVLTWTDTGLVNGQSYYYKVSALNSVGEGGQSNEASATPDVVPSDDLEYAYINSGTEVQITGYTGAGGSVVIPSSIDGRPVTSIANYAFYGVTTITSVTMSPNLRTIGNYAFYKCSALTSAALPAGLQSIGEYAFGSCTSLTSIDIPGSVTTLGSTCFYNCKVMTSVTLHDGLRTIGDHAFYYCTALRSISIPGTVTAINNWAFAYSGVTAANVPGSVTALGSYAFYQCASLSSVTVSSGVQSIGYQAFRGCVALTSVVVPSSVSSIGGYAFYGCSALASVTLSTGLKTIGDYAFCNCYALTSINVPGTVTSIGAYAFYYCSGLTSVTLNEGLQSIGDHAFYRCAGLKTITMPATVSSIGSYAFYGCSGITSMYFQGNAPSVGTGWISARSSALKIYYHAGATGFTNPWQGVPTSTY